jgi:murein DD-endopeptidase MepM/ murein hydrolase activator NlpD
MSQRDKLLAILGVKRAGFVRPAKGSCTSPFGPRELIPGTTENHNGIDIANSQGTPIIAMADGKVIRTQDNDPEYDKKPLAEKSIAVQALWGNLIVLQHKNNVTSWYAHMVEKKVKMGEKVLKGQQIGLMGTTGRSTGSHLHLTVKKDNRAVDPAEFFEV